MDIIVSMIENLRTNLIKKSSRPSAAIIQPHIEPGSGALSESREMVMLSRLIGGTE